MVAKKIGVLALQGDFHMHAHMLRELGAEVFEIRLPEELSQIDALILPGGESTTITKIMSDEMRSALNNFAVNHPLWGTCAGMIMLSKTQSDNRVRPLNLIDLDIDRNGFGRQVHSFESELRLSEDFLLVSGGIKGGPSAEQGLRSSGSLPKLSFFHGVFIRAPRVKSHGASVKELAWYNDEPVALRQDNFFVTSFHPELSDDDRFHRYFLSMIT